MPDDASPPADTPSELASPPAEVSAEPREPESAHTPVYEPIPEVPHEPISAPPSEPEKSPAETPREASAPAQNATRTSRDLLAQARDRRLALRQGHLDAIAAEITKRGSLSNKDVKKLLHISDASATRYLSELVKQGKIKREGKGRGVVYVKL